MSTVRLAAFVSAAWLTFEFTALAQPAVDRVEGQIRRQIGESTQPAPAKPVPAASEPGYLGVIADEASVPGSGVVLREVVPAGPAALAGLQASDRVTAINGRAVGRVADMASLLSNLPVGTKLDFQVDRGGTVSTLVVTLAARPTADQRRFENFGYIPGAPPSQQPRAVPASGPRLGVRTLGLTDADRARLGTPTLMGARVMAITPGSAAAQSGIPLGAVITAVDGQPVRGPEELGMAIRSRTPGRPVELVYYAGGQEVRTQLMLAGASQPAPSRAVVPRPAPAQAPVVHPAPAVTTAESRVDALERRIRELEERIRKLEAERTLQIKPAG